MGLPNTVNQLFNGGSPYYIVNRSLRFRASASAYLTRTPSVAGNNQKFTWSGWVKRGALGLADLFSAGTGDNNRTLAFFDASNYLIFGNNNSGLYYGTQTSAVFRDCSAWYHIIFSIDTTQATTANRVRLYVNGVEQTSTVAWNSGYIPQNTTTYVNATNPQMLGSNPTYGLRDYFDGYMAEVNFIDGQQLTPSSFGVYDSNGIWQPIKYTGTYGTNGFYLPFSNTTSTTTLVADASGNGNNWTPNNISLTSGVTYDSMLDSPTVSNASSNYAVLNPTQPSGGTYQAGNQQFLANTAGQWKTAVGTMFATSGKYYWEVTAVALPTAGYVWGGAASSAINLASSTYNGASALPIGGDTNGWGVGVSGGNIYKYYNGSGTIITAGTDSVGDVWMVAVDIDAAKIWFGRNGTWLGSGDPATGANAAFTNLSGSIGPACSAYLNTGATAGLNCGQRPFSYTPPSGYNALNTANLPQPLISNGANYMAATLYTGNGGTQTINNGTNTTIGTSFQPDFVWIKNRAAAVNHQLQNSNAGWQYGLNSNNTNAEYTDANAITGATSSGWSMNNNYNSHNQSGVSYVGWNWKAGAGTTSTNTSGSITSTVSVSAQSGFSIATYTGTGAVATVGHGLGVTPNMIIWKNRSAAENWVVYHSSLGATGNVYLNLTNGFSTDSTTQNNTSPTSSVFTIATSGAVNGSAKNIVAYCFAAVRGFSAFGSYTGNGSADGPFIFTGHRPRWVMVKKSSAIGNWLIFDTSRSPFNVNDDALFPNLSNAETTTSSYNNDFLSNGFKIRTSDGSWNDSGVTYIYASFAESPFNISRGR